MLVQIGARRIPGDVVDALAECHERIRTFLSLAQQLANREDIPEGEVRSAAGQVQRYFAEAFPLHRADEDELVVPRLSGASDELDRALATMCGDHAAHEPAVARLVALCARLEHDPQDRAARGGELAATVAELTAGLEPHLALEERVIFPALRRIPAPERAAIHRAMRARRQHPGA